MKLHNSARLAPPVICVLGVALGLPGAAAQESSPPAEPERPDVALTDESPPATPSEEPVPPAFLTDNLRFTIDISSRVSVSTITGKPSAVQSIGFDLLKVFSDEGGDWGTLLLQGYVNRLDNVQARPPFYEDDDDWEFQFRFFNFNFTRVGGGRLNFKIGHFEIPYGLEQTLDTNGTLHDFTNGRNLGIKADWGVTINGVLPTFEYETSLSRGTGNEYFDHGHPYAFAGRIGTPRSENLVLGASVFHGRVWNPGAVAVWRAGNAKENHDGDRPSRRDRRGDKDVIRRTRVGLDVQWYLDLFGALADVSYGRDYSQDVFNTLLELNWRNPDETWDAYFQTRLFLQRFARGWDDELQTVVGARYRPDGHWSFSAQYEQDVTRFNDAARGATISLQVRYRF